MGMRHKKINPAMVTADVVAISHLVIANLLYGLGEHTRIFQFMGSLRPGRDLVYGYLDYPVFVALHWTFQFLSNFFGAIPLISFTGSWFQWFFIDTDDKVFRWMHAEFVIVIASLFYGLVAYLFVKMFLVIFGLEED